MVPDWLGSMRDGLGADLPKWFADHPPPPDPRRSSAVLVLFGPGPDGQTRLVLTERARHLRSHARQVVFPGGHVDPGETAIEAALRESAEEVGVDPSTVDVVSALPGVYLTPQRTELVPVLGWWREPHAIGVVDPREVARVLEPTVAALVDPANRFTATAPGGYTGPAFLVDGLVVWGLTANLLATVLDLAGLSRPWDSGISRPLPRYLLRPYRMDA